MLKKIGISIFVIFLCTGMTMVGKWKKKFNIKPYAKKTEQLNEYFVKLDSMLNLDGMDVCPNLYKYDELKDRRKILCDELESLTITTGKSKKTLITLNDDCIIESEKIRFRKESHREFFLSKFMPLDTMMRDLAKDTRTYLYEIRTTCFRQYNTCKAIKKAPSNKWALNQLEWCIEVSQKGAAELSNDSVAILNRIKSIETDLISQSSLSGLYRTMLVAFVDHNRYLLSGQKDVRRCSDAHIRWTELLERYTQLANACDRDLILEVSTDKNWMEVIDSSWVANKYIESLDCVRPLRATDVDFKPIPERRKGCMCVFAENYDPDARDPADICIGCMDPLAENYCPSAKVQRDIPCIYKACTKWCYAESPLTLQDTLKLFPKYKQDRDVIELDESLCKTDVCGCMDPCAAGYDSLAIAKGEISRNYRPDTCSIVCGCLEEDAVNYAYRTSGPDWLIDKYADPSIKKNNPDVCIYTGCTDSCALNYDPLARINDGSCICKADTRNSLNKKITQIEWQIADENNSVTNLTTDWINSAPDDVLKNKNIRTGFKKRGNDLLISVNVKKMQVNAKQTITASDSSANLGLGKYNFPEVISVIDALLVFMDTKSADLKGKTIEIDIIGEADGHPIGAKGISFQNGGIDITNEAFRELGPNQGTSMSEIEDKNFNIDPNKTNFNLLHNQDFDDNLTLAFLRAYMVKQKLLNGTLPADEFRINVAAKANTKKGSKYRRVSTVFTIIGFYQSDPSQPAPLKLVDVEYDNLLNAQDFFQRLGYPDGKFVNGVPMGTIKYDSCPCY